MNATTIQKGFLFAGLSNVIGAPLFSKLFTNQPLLEAQPGVMGWFGLVCIMLWGLAYISVRKSYAAVPWLIGVFVLEKLLYVAVWIHWHANNSVSTLFEQDALAGIFFGIYGINDFVFMLFFAWVFVQLRKSQS